MPPFSCINLSNLEQGELLAIARQSIEAGLAGGNVSHPNIDKLPGSLAIQLGAFVTLTRYGRLRGCIGALESSDPLVKSVANAAFNAAFHDSRFAPLAADEVEDTRLEISVLSRLQPLTAANRMELLDRLNPGEDGLLIEDGHYRSTFLPKVWDNITDSDEFLNHLLAKAGLPENYWSETIRFKRYQALSFGE